MKTARLFAVFALLAICSIARADVPRTIAFQGTLKDAAGTPITGSRQVTFTLYDAATEGTPLWTETQTVTPANGLFAVPLGSVMPLNLPFDKPYWVGIKVGDDAEMVPRVPLMSAPYALAIPGMTVDKNGRVGINGGADAPLTISPISPSLDWIAFRTLAGATDWHVNNFGGGMNFVQSGVADFRLFLQPGGAVGLGTSSPMSKFHVANGDIFVQNGGNAAGAGASIFMASNAAVAGAAIKFGLTDSVAGIDAGSLTLLTRPNPYVPLSAGLIVTADGNVNMSGQLTVTGNARAQTLTLTSSRRFKRDVQPLTNALGTLGQLQGVSYVWDEEHGGKPDIGFIAEDAGKVVPELVTWEPNGVDAVGMDYSHLTALTVEGIKEQQAEIESLKAESAAKDTRIADLESRLARLERLVEGK